MPSKEAFLNVKENRLLVVALVKGFAAIAGKPDVMDINAAEKEREKREEKEMDLGL